MKKNSVLTTVEQIRSLKASLRSYKLKCASQERQIKRLLSDTPQMEAEAEIRRLEERCENLTQLLEEAEQEIRMLKKQIMRSVA